MAEKISSFTLDGINVTVTPDDNEPDKKDRIEITLHNKDKIKVLSLLMICARDDYSRVYYVQISSPAVPNKSLHTQTCSDFDTQGFPHKATIVDHDNQGNLRLHETYQVEDVHLNMLIPKEVFEFDPPEDYAITDFRLPEAERLTLEIKSMKNVLKSEAAPGRRLEILMNFWGLLKDDHPDKLKDILNSFLEDEDPYLRKNAATMLQVLESRKDHLEQDQTTPNNKQQ